MQLIAEPVRSPNPNLREVRVRADRRTLAKRLWRVVADDGKTFGLQLEQPLQDGDVIWESDRARYVLQQLPEPVLEIPFAGQAEPPAALAWAVGNLHFPVEVQPDKLVAPDDPALRQSLGRSHITFEAKSAPFRPHRFAAAASPHSHAHDHSH